MTPSSQGSESPPDPGRFKAIPQVGAAGFRVDIGVRHPDKPGRYVLGVECDGAMYHSSKVARDRDRLRQSLLEDLGWHIYRIWGISWYRDRARQQEQLREAIEDAVKSGSRRRIAESPTAPPEVETDVVDFTAPPDWAIPYKSAALDRFRGKYDFHAPEARRHIKRLLQEFVECESPVHEERALRAVREAWGLKRSGGRVKTAFADAVRTSSKTIRRDSDGFLWHGEEKSVEVRVPTADPRTDRSHVEVPEEERKRALYLLVRDARRISREDLSAAVAGLFGWQRRSGDIHTALDNALDSLIIDDGCLEEKEGQLQTSDVGENGVPRGPSSGV